MKKVLGKGTFYIMIAEAVFIVTSYAMHLILGRRLGPALYGTFGVVLYITTTVRSFLLTGIPRAVSKYTAEDYSLADAIRNQGLKIQIIFGIIILIIFVSFSGLVGNLLKDSELEAYLKISAFIIPLAAIYSVFIFSLNGLRKFKSQARLMSIYYFARAAIVIGFVYLGFSVSGAILGLVFANLSGVLIGFYYSGIRLTTQYFPAKQLIKFAIPLVFFSFSAVLLMNLDLLFVKALIAEKAMTGFYTSAKTIARVPYYLFGALSFTLLPSISKSIYSQDTKLTTKYINQSLRYMMIFLVPATLIISSTALNLVRFTYSIKYEQASVPLSILIFGFMFFSFFMVLSTVITASGKPRISMCFAMAMIPLNIILNIILIPHYQLIGAAISTTLSFFWGMVIAGVYVYNKFRTLISLSSFFKILIAGSIIYIISILYPISGIAIVLQYLVLSGLYIGLLFLLKEIKKEDIDVLKNIFSKKKNLTKNNINVDKNIEL